MRTTGAIFSCNIGAVVVQQHCNASEGVWMSITPTQDALLVALDFEGVFETRSRGPFLRILLGVHSIERSPQEDALLVLFNTAISNLVRMF